MAENDEIRFFVATQTLKPQNQIHLVELNESTSTLKQRVSSNIYFHFSNEMKNKFNFISHAQIFSHPEGEIWKLNSSPHDPRLLVSCFSTVKSSQVVLKSALYRLPDFSDNFENKEFFNFESTEILDTDSYGSDIKTTEFHTTDPNLLATVVDEKILLHQRTEPQTRIIAEIKAKNAPKITTGKWSHHHQGSQFIALINCGIRSYDIRDPNHYAWSIDEAHSQTIRDLDCNPNKHCHFVTGGDDGAMKIWDNRSTKEAVFVRKDHQHWYVLN